MFQNINLNTFLKGGLEEDVNRAFDAIRDNILNERTDPEGVRKIVIEISMQPDADRKTIKCAAKVTPKPVGTITGGMLYIAHREGEIIITDQLTMFEDDGVTMRVVR